VISLLVPPPPQRPEEDPVSALDAAIDSPVLDSPALDRTAERIGGRIRALRLARGFTLVRLAERCELSHSFLSQLERGRARPSMVSLEKIARALGSSQLELIAAADDLAPGSPRLLVRADEGTRGHYGEGQARMLVHGARRFHPMEFTGSNLEPGDFFSHAEDEFIHVVAGAVIVELGEETSILREGDSLYYVGGTQHRWTALGPDGYRLFVVKEKPEQL
jgi:transcriptional regulator with XRE-family HTH domain